MVGRYLLKRLLQQQALSEVLHQSLSSQTPQPSSNVPSPSPSPSISAAAVTPPMNPAQPRPSSQSVAQLLGEVEKRKKKTAVAGLAVAGAAGLKVKKKAVREVLGTDSLCFLLLSAA